jgi:allophanate hydrolase
VRAWGLAEYGAAVGAGASASELVDDALAALAGAPPGVLIGPPCADLAHADAAALVGVDPATRPLYGVPFVVKDNIDVAGLPTTSGCPGAAYVAERDADVVARLRAAGAIVVGKANLDQFATGLVGTRSPYGTPPNVLDPAIVPGGSSSGSAVAVALGLVPFALGTDTAGSGRVPAALNGVVGLKPTVGRMSTVGVAPAVRSLDCPSVFARTVADAATVAASMVGATDATTRPPAQARPMAWPPRVGVPARWPADAPLDPPMAAWFAAAVDRLAAFGCPIVPVDVGPHLELGRLLYGSALVAERAAAIGELVAKDVDGLDPVVAGIIARAADHGGVDVYRAEHAAAEARRAVAAAFEAVDVLALPATPGTATLDEVADDPVGRNQFLGTLTTFVNLADLACVTVPMAPAVPAGLQLIGPAWSDADLAALAEGYARGDLGDRDPACAVVVVGAHLAGQPLNHQLTSRGAVLRRSTTTAPTYRLYELANTVPPKPGLVRVAGGGASIEVELWAITPADLGAFLLDVPAPLAIGTVELADGSWWKGFVCEPGALDGATDITHAGGWRRHLTSRP